jgi:uncharacterized protein YgiB involved in biofilm formation
MSNTPKKLTGITTAVCMALALAACGEDPVETHAYTSIDECKSSGVYDAPQCTAAYNNAMQAHEQSAPRYMSLADCEEDYGVGNCSVPGATAPTEVHVHNQQSGSTFMPFFIGYMLGGGFDSNGTRVVNNNYHTPLYRSTSGGYKTMSGQSVSRAAFTKAGAKTSPSTFTKPSKPTTYKAGESGKKVAAQRAAAAKATASKPKTSTFKSSGFK